MLENYIFHISPMYEFSHSQGQTRPSDDLRRMTALTLLSGHGWIRS